MLKPKTTLLYFVKYPEPGKVKTRLAASIGIQEAAHLYRNLAEQNLQTLQSSLEKNTSLWVLYDPPGAETSVRNWLPGEYSLIPQRGDDLSARLLHAFQSAFANGMTKAIAIGSDTINLTPEHVRHAVDELDKNTLVVGPARDGGYYLIGLNKYEEYLFENIPWSSAKVLETTLQKAKERNVSYSLLSELEDLDTSENLEAIRS